MESPRSANSFALKLIVFTMLFQLSTGFLSKILGVPCALVVGALKSGSCGAEFHRSIEPFQTEDGKILIPVLCCAATTLRYCVTEEIEKQCGSVAKDVIDSVINGIVKTVKFSGGNPPCNGDEFYYRKESPICWPVWGHGVGAVFLALLVLAICCICWKICCSKKKNRPNILHYQSPTSNPSYTVVHN